MIDINSLVMTCWACPSQWEAVTTDKKHVYIRYRWGTLRVDIDQETVLSKGIGDSLDGVLTTEELLKLLKEAGLY